jgi:hypothetical protein
MLGIIIIVFIMFLVATVFNIATYLFFKLLELIGLGVRKLLGIKQPEIKTRY